MTDTDELRKLYTQHRTDDVQWRRHRARYDLAESVPSLLDELDRLRSENDVLQDDVLGFVTQRNVVCSRLAARIIPGPDGQDDIDRRRLIEEVFEDSWEEVDGWQEKAAKGAAVIAERDRLARELEELRSAAREVVSHQNVDIAMHGPKMNHLRALVAPSVPETQEETKP